MNKKYELHTESGNIYYVEWNVGISFWSSKNKPWRVRLMDLQIADPDVTELPWDNPEKWVSTTPEETLGHRVYFFYIKEWQISTVIVKVVDVTDELTDTE